ncbi:MAG TPA: multicopper oxidase family protein [Polyangiaceae bacterium]|nr:multicopper oxidase family protein [Polyangiaceae bacterium]
MAGVSTAEYLGEDKTADVWAYRDGAIADAVGTVPGPLLRAKVGDEVIVHFKNELPVDETTIHWHGIRLPPEADGTPSSQAPVLPGSEYEYRFTARDASSFWYHPHVRADEQIERGLYAPMVVTGGITPEVSADRYLVLDDIKLNANGALNEDITEMDRMMGRQGNVLLINGQRAPVELHVAPGSRERWRFVNAANGRFFNLRVPNASLLVIGSDGGILAEPYAAETLLVTPGERYDVLVTFDGDPSEATTLQTIHHDRGHDLADPGPQDLLSIVYDGAAVIPAPLPDAWGELPALPVTDTTPIRPFVLEEYETPGLPVIFTINGEQWPDSQPVEVTQGAVEIWEVRNDAEMDHPFHLHGMFFQVLSDTGETSFPGWKDTVNIPQLSTVRFAVQYDPPGMWMFHCHILEHAELGMMGALMVMP